MDKPLPTCSLCRAKPANQTNSHIFSWFLIREAINKHGVKGRENEVVFSLNGEYVRTYIGREQSAEEQVIPIKGRPLNEQEIQESEKGDFTVISLIRLLKTCDFKLYAEKQSHKGNSVSRILFTEPVLENADEDESDLD